MVTVERQNKVIDRLNKTSFEFRGLSTDTKPTNKYKDVNIANGSLFIEMDTEDLFFYNEDTSSWVGGTE